MYVVLPLVGLMSPVTVTSAWPLATFAVTAGDVPVYDVPFTAIPVVTAVPETVVAPPQLTVPFALIAVIACPTTHVPVTRCWTTDVSTSHAFVPELNWIPVPGE